jgi:hypothetical protein
VPPTAASTDKPITAARTSIPIRSTIIVRRSARVGLAPTERGEGA